MSRQDAELSYLLAEGRLPVSSDEDADIIAVAPSHPFQRFIQANADDAVSKGASELIAACEREAGRQTEVFKAADANHCTDAPNPWLSKELRKNASRVEEKNGWRYEYDSNGSIVNARQIDTNDGLLEKRAHPDGVETKKLSFGAFWQNTWKDGKLVKSSLYDPEYPGDHWAHFDGEGNEIAA